MLNQLNIDVNVRLGKVFSKRIWTVVQSIKNSIKRIKWCRRQYPVVSAPTCSANAFAAWPEFDSHLKRLLPVPLKWLEPIISCLISAVLSRATKKDWSCVQNTPLRSYVVDYLKEKSFVSKNTVANIECTLNPEMHRIFCVSTKYCIRCTRFLEFTYCFLYSIQVSEAMVGIKV